MKEKEGEGEKREDKHKVATASPGNVAIGLAV